MMTKVLAAAVLVLAGCGEVDSEALKALNKPVETEVVKQQTSEPIKTKEKLEKQVSTQKIATKIQPLPAAVKEQSTSKAIIPPKESKSSKKEKSFSFAKNFKTETKKIVSTKPMSTIKSQKVESNSTSEAAVSGKPAIKIFNEQEHKYKLALEELQKKIELAKVDSSLEIELAKLEQDKIALLKAKELELAKSEAEQKVALARIKLDQTQTLERTKQMQHSGNREKALQESSHAQEIAKIQEHNRVMLDQKRLELYKIAAVIAGILLLLILMIFFLLRRGTQESKVKMHEDELNQQLQLKMLEQQGKNLEKMLEIVASKDLNKSVEKELLLTIKDSQKKTLIFDEKPKRSLIFRK